MGDEEISGQFLDELKLQTRLYRSSVKFSVAILLLFFVGLFAFSYFINQKSHGWQQEPRLSWNKVEDLLDKGDYDEAEKIALALLEKSKEDYYPHACLARLYLRKGDLPKAVNHAEIAYRLFPDKYNDETLLALKKRVASENAQKAKTASGK